MPDLGRDGLSIGHAMEMEVFVETPGCQQRPRGRERDEHGRTDMSPEVSDEAPIGDAKEQDPPVLSRRGDELTVRRESETPTRDDGPKLRSGAKLALAPSEGYGKEQEPR